MQIPDCPNCSAPMHPTSAACEHCDLEIRAKFTPNEFARLAPKELNFLRVFVACEGRIKEMERALNLSYPTIKNLMANLKRQLTEPNQKKSHSNPKPNQRKENDVRQLS